MPHRAVGAVLSAREDEDALHRRITQEVDQQAALALAGRRTRRAVRPCRPVVATGVTATWPDHGSNSSASPRNGARHGGREEQSLPLLRQFRHDAPDRVDEAHVEHLVGFVEHEDLDLVEAQRAAVEMVEQAAWRRHQDVDAARQGLRLLPDRNAAEHHGNGELCVAPIGLEAFGDLARELACRRENEGPAGSWLRPARIGGGQALQDRQRERRRLAGAGLRDPAKVLAGENLRDGLRLDRGRR